MAEDGIESDMSSTSSEDDICNELPNCGEVSFSMITPPEHFSAFLENKPLLRDVEPIMCSKEIIENVFSNYVIVKNILKNLRWQDKLICTRVCTLWDSVVSTLWKEYRAPVAFCITLTGKALCKVGTLNKSQEFLTMPLAVFSFCSRICSIGCNVMVPSPCNPACNKVHCVLDFIYHETSVSKDCLLTVKADGVFYLPLPPCPTSGDAIMTPFRGCNLIFSGIYIPEIPGVDFKVINALNSDQIYKLKEEIIALSEKYIIKGAIAYLTNNYLFYGDQDTAESLQFLNTLQPDKPFAFGGCLVEDTATHLNTIDEDIDSCQGFFSRGLFAVGIFMVPKDVELQCNFEIYSLVIEQSEWTKAKIAQTIEEFSQRVPRYEHSAALKLSCIGRQRKHEVEQNLYRSFFPDTPIGGCMGNGELGVNIPFKKPRTFTQMRPRDASKQSTDKVAYDNVHSYSTIFIHFCWGKILAPAEVDS